MFAVCGRWLALSSSYHSWFWPLLLQQWSWTVIYRWPLTLLRATLRTLLMRLTMETQMKPSLGQASTISRQISIFFQSISRTQCPTWSRISAPPLPPTTRSSMMRLGLHMQILRYFRPFVRLPHKLSAAPSLTAAHAPLPTTPSLTSSSATRVSPIPPPTLSKLKWTPTPLPGGKTSLILETP